MNSKWILIVCLFSLIPTSFSRPNGDSPSSGSKAEAKKSDFSLLKRLERSGVGVKKRAEERGDLEDDDGTKIELVESPKSLLPDTKSSKEPAQDSSPEVPPLPEDESAARVKKQSPNNVCIKVGGCGKTMCGSVVSARGPVVGDVAAIVQGAKPISPLPNLHTSVAEDAGGAVSSRMKQFSPVQGRTFDLMSMSPLSYAYGSAQYSPTSYSVSTSTSSDGGGSSLGYGHSFFKPQAIPAVPVAVISQHQPHSLVHPWLLPHLLPHILPHVTPSLMSGMTSFVTPHKYELQHYPEPPSNEIKQPVQVAPPGLTHYSYASSDNALICQPIRNQRLDNIYDYVYKPDVAADKSLNVSETAKKVQSTEEESRIQDHMRKVNEIKDEITQLNRAAQRIVDQQERLTQMQQKHLWGGSSSMSSSHASDSMNPYMGTGYYSHPTMPWGYSRSNILSYPNSYDDIEFFMNLMKAGKKIGVISDSFQNQHPGQVNAGGTTESVQTQKQTTETATDGNNRPEPGKNVHSS